MSVYDDILEELQLFPEGFQLNPAQRQTVIAYKAATIALVRGDIELHLQRAQSDQRTALALCENYGFSRTVVRSRIQKRIDTLQAQLDSFNKRFPEAHKE